MPFPDSDGAPAPVTAIEPDAHGQAALLLAESILHSLIEKRVLTLKTAVATVQSAADVKLEVATEAGESKKRMNESLELLERIADSLATDSRGARPDGSSPSL